MIELSKPSFEKALKDRDLDQCCYASGINLDLLLMMSQRMPVNHSYEGIVYGGRQMLDRLRSAIIQQTNDWENLPKKFYGMQLMHCPYGVRMPGNMLLIVSSTRKPTNNIHHAVSYTDTTVSEEGDILYPASEEEINESVAVLRSI